MTIVHGKLANGENSRLSDATLQALGGGAVQLQFDSETVVLQADSLSISSRLGSSARYIEINNVGRFETSDNDGVDQLAKTVFSKDKSSFIHRLESNLGLIAVAVVVTVLVTAAAVKWGIPALSDKIVASLPEKTADILEDKLLASVEERWFKESKLDSERQAQLQRLFTQVAIELNAKQVSDTDSKEFVFKLRDAKDSIGANALAFPSGTIIMTDQLVKLATSDKQIAGVMAHEIGHLKGKHSLRQLVRGSLLTFIVAFIAGDISGASSAVIAAPVVLLELRYSREFEAEADGYAIDYFECDIEGLRAMGSFFEQLGQPDTELEKGIVKEASNEAEDQTINKSANEDAESSAKNSKLDFELPEYLTSHPLSQNRKTMFEEHISSECAK